MKCRRKKSRRSGIFQATAKASHLSYREMLMQMRLALNVIGNRHRQVGQADTRRAVIGQQQRIRAQTITARAGGTGGAVFAKTQRWGEKSPIHLTLPAQIAPQIPLRISDGKQLWREIGRIDQRHTIHQQTARTADN